MQSKEWASLRQGFGWQAHEVEGISILEKKLPLGKSFLYGPEIQVNSTKLQDLLENTKKIAQNSKAIFLRLDFIDEFDENLAQKLKDFGFIKAFEETQPQWRQIIDITPSEEDILAQMKPKGRYNIKVAQKHNIQIKKSTNIPDFYKIFRQTAHRDGFEIRPQKYFADLLQILAPEGFVELLTAHYNEKAIAAEIVSYYDDTASYLYGASTNEYRNLMAPYLLHWQAIKNAKAKGCFYYDLLAIAPEGIENHKYSGLTRFKEQFGGRKVHLVGGWDLVYKPFWYRMFKFFEKMRRQ